MMSSRIALLNNDLTKRRLDGFIVTDPVNVKYLSGFMGHDSVILVTANKNYFFTDSRYVEEAKKGLKAFEVQLVNCSMAKSIAEAAADRKVKRLGFEAMNIPYAVAERLKSSFQNIELVPTTDVIGNLRAVKDRGEITRIKASIKLAKLVMKKVSRMIQPGLTETSIARAVEMEFINEGAKTAFDTIAASGPNSSMPHARAGSRKILANDFVMMDMGCVLDNYCSDITRMFTTGRSSNKYKKICEIVQDAHDIAIKKIKPGVSIADVDAAARDYIKSKGFGTAFGHSLGHGIGLEVHEEPTISGSSAGTLKTGFVFTVEPAIYLPGFGGVRIEDVVLVTDSGCEVLTR